MVVVHAELTSVLGKLLPAAVTREAGQLWEPDSALLFSKRYSWNSIAGYLHYIQTVS
jgi:hypothetical protein